jgi:signal transduction histidine kinase
VRDDFLFSASGDRFSPRARSEPNGMAGGNRPPTTDQAELLSLAVHEFRTPVTVVAGYLRMLSREQLGPLSDRQRKVVEEAERACGRLSALVTEMSELSGLEGRGKAALAPAGEVALGPLLDEIANQVQEGRDRGVALARRGDASAMTVDADRGRLKSALEALATAVLREQAEATEVVLQAAVEDRDGRRVAVLTIGRDGAAGTLMETGGPDARLNEFRGGLGLALPIARRVIEQAGGRTWSSAAGRTLGAVAVLLPLKETAS